MSEIKLENYESEDKMVSHPSHYQSENGLEVIDAVEAFTEGLEGKYATNTGNVIKYICRWKKKNGLQDLEKAMWYLQRLINHVKKESTVITKTYIDGNGNEIFKITEKENN